MNLHNGHPYWLIKNGILSNYPSLKDDAKCDVVVIGAGVTGAFVAQALACAGVDVIVLDKRDVGTGSTAASTALLQHAADTELIELTSEWVKPVPSANNSRTVKWREWRLRRPRRTGRRLR